jgi:hypothetical protein
MLSSSAAPGRTATLRSGRRTKWFASKWFASVRRLAACDRDLNVASTMGLSSLFLFLALASPALSGDFLEENGFFRVTIAGRSYRLEALTVKRADSTGRLPIALIAHGKPGNLQGMLDDHAKNFVEIARDLASRGWLAVAVIRRGFGQSDGPMPSPVTCQSTSFIPRFTAEKWGEVIRAANIKAQ